MSLVTCVKAACCTAFLTLFAFSSIAQTTQFSWQSPHAKVSAKGDLEWAPLPFAYTPGASVRYIDFEGGNDNATGTSTTTAFKHHPWDTKATGNALACTGVQTYVFKRGVIYRGTLTAKESGTPGNPIRLTSDPSWGTGEACIYGSERVTSGWTRCTAANVRNIPNPTSVWYKDLGSMVPSGQLTQMVCEVTGGAISRITLARAPNWAITDSNFPMKGWWLSGGNPGYAGPVLVGTYTTNTASDWIGGTVWSTWGTTTDMNMGTVQMGGITGYNTSTKVLAISIRCDPHNYYHVENLPQLLDTTNEYYYEKGTSFPGRMFLRLSGDRDPNTAVIEVAVRTQIIVLSNVHDVTVSGLTLAFNNLPASLNNPSGSGNPAHWGTSDGNNQAVAIMGACSNVEVSNCRFRYVIEAVAPGNSTASPVNVFTGIRVTDNDIAFNDDQAITLANAGSDCALSNISILRNNLYFIGNRQTCRSYSSIPAILVGGVSTAEIAGNIVNYCWGNGIDCFWGSSSSNLSTAAIRGLVHHNKVTHTLLGTNDWGGIEGWYGGPAYYYSNISANPHGYKSWDANSSGANPWGHAYYFDHAYAQKMFNNIAWGSNSDPWDARNRVNSAFMQCVGGYITYANNTAYNFYKAFSYSQPNDFYLGNLCDTMSYWFFDTDGALPFNSFVNNVFHGNPVKFSADHQTFTAFQQNLASANAQASQLGWVATSPVMVDPGRGDFRPVSGGEAAGRGVKVFISWGLSNVTGEWNFFVHPADPTVVMGENYNMVGGWDVPTYSNLSCPGATTASFVRGALEDWTNGALHFNGTSTYGTVANSTSSTPRNNLDMSSGNFLIEAYLRTSASAGVIAAKAATAGYQLDINSSGQARMSLLTGGTTAYSLSSIAAINNGQWRHVIAEVSRTGAKVNMYVDGVLSNGTATGTIPGAGVSLSNTSDFFAGKNTAGNFFTGDIDFLRVSRGTLADAKTTIEELYAWELNGPFLRDFTGFKPTGPRDAGALQYTEIITAVRNPQQDSPAQLQQQVAVDAADGLSVAGIQQNIDRSLMQVQHRRGQHNEIQAQIIAVQTQASTDIQKPVLERRGISGIGTDAEAGQQTSGQIQGIPGIDGSQDGAIPKRDEGRRGVVAVAGAILAMAAVALGAGLVHSNR